MFKGYKGKRKCKIQYPCLVEMCSSGAIFLAESQDRGVCLISTGDSNTKPGKYVCNLGSHVAYNREVNLCNEDMG